MDVHSHPREDATTPKPHHAAFFGSTSAGYPEHDDQSGLKTPTRDSFHIPPPSTSYPQTDANAMLPPVHTASQARTDLNRSASLRSGGSGGASATGEDTAGEQDVSDDEGTAGDAKKKKGQRFYCTGYRECNLSFTRSEHLARHIRYLNQPKTFRLYANTIHAGNIPVNGLFSAIAYADSPDWTTCVSMHKPFTATRTFQSTRWLPPAHASRGRFARTV